ncbi:MAG: DinB family protein [Gordonia sp. (in: high G+C Gram-positive bacteria)]|uniref:DinB family protein n=1 Tax=Gordonia sp. (in: high G+C Gram-positive bacteria) TaxID=84139 RepID=UPI0039E6D4A5
MGTTAVTETTDTVPELTGERADLLAELRQARFFLRYTARDLTTEQASQRTTASALTLGGLIKHVALTEAGWAEFFEKGAEALSVGGKDFADLTEEDYAERDREFALQPGETLDAVLARYAEIAARTDEAIRTTPSLDVRHALPDAPWFTESEWSIRRVVTHLIAETAQHAGHADIIRESLDGAQTMA